jgi:uncharacterized protein YecE (DUF72 family)
VTIRVGTAGWSYADWEGRVWPRPRPPGFHGLAWLARYFDCIEVNSTFYALPDPRHVEHWVRIVEDRPDFRFAAKLLQRFTHEAWDPADADVERDARAYRAAIDPLVQSGKLSAVLVQYPFSTRATEAAGARLERLHELFADLPLVLELRHASWFREPARSRLVELPSSLAWIDWPAGPDQAPREFEPSGPLGYMRLHGRNAAGWSDPRAGRDQRYDHLYARDEIDEVVDRVRRLAAGRDETLVVTNNHFSGKAVANGLELVAALQGRVPAAPAPLVEAFPYLQELVRVEGQHSLFD